MAHPADVYNNLWLAGHVAHSRDAAERRAKANETREAVTQSAQRWLRQLSGDLPGLFSGASDADLRRVAERVAAVVLVESGA